MGYSRFRSDGSGLCAAGSMTLFAALAALVAVGAATAPAGAGSSTCCFSTGELGCDDAGCEETVCGVDPYCCDVSWDSTCADEAHDLCDGLCVGGGGGGTDSCVEPESIFGVGTFYYSTSGATPDPGPISPGCDYGGTPGFANDVWFCWTSPCDGNAMISFWDLGPLAKFAVYDGCICPPDESSVLACGANAKTFPVEEGASYLIRIGLQDDGKADLDGQFRLQCVGDGSVQCATGVACQLPDQLGHGSPNATGYTSFPEGGAVADDFTPTDGGLIQSVCWWGHYFDFTSGDCTGPVGLGKGDLFYITYYYDETGKHTPGALAAGPYFVTPTTFLTGNYILTSLGPVAEFQYEATHPGFEISGGECLWISITNELYGPCFWVWASAPGGDLRGAVNNGEWAPFGFDLAFCVNEEAHPYGCDQLVPPSNDDCANAIDITGESVVNYDTSLATTDGPEHFESLFYGDAGIRDDVWYCWTAPFSGEVVVSTCSLTGVDTKMAVYARCECPVTDFDLITWSDDFCAIQSSVTFTVFEGLDYLIRVGTWPQNPGGPGVFEVSYTIIELPAPQEFPAEGESIIEDVGDLDNDGDVDVVVAIPDQDPDRPGQIQVFLNLGNDEDGNWLGLEAQEALGVGRDPSGIAIADYDDDDYLDVAVSNRGDNTVSIFLNSDLGDGVLHFAFNLITGKDPSAVAAADFTHDGLDDLAVASEFDNEVTIFGQIPVPPLGPGGGFGETETIMSGGDAPVALEPEDVDNDKDVDLIILNRGSGGGFGSATTVQFQSGSSAGSATAPVGLQPEDVATGLLDGDLLPDTAVSNRGGGTATIFLTDEGLLGPLTIPVGDDPRSIHAVDLDGDGDADLVVAANDAVIGPAVQVVANLLEGGGPAFGPPVGFSVNADPNFVASADFDGDGTFDIVTANTDAGATGGSVSVLLNSAPPAPCGADFDGGGYIGFGDMVALLLAWGPCEEVKCPYDVNGDGDVGFGDLKELMIFWGDCRPDDPPQP